MAFTNYKDLTVWEKSMDLTDEIYQIVKKLPKEELYAISDQIRRCAVSIPSNIAEGRGRQTDADFRHFLYIAKGSCYELETQLLICVRQRFLSDEDVKKSLSLTEEISRMLSNLIRTLC